MGSSLKRVAGAGVDFCQSPLGNFELRWDNGRNKKQYRVLSTAYKKYQELDMPAQLWSFCDFNPVLLEEKAIVETETWIDRSEVDKL